MKNLVTSILIFWLCMLFSCQAEPYPSFFYRQTQCADPWEIRNTPQTNEELIFLFKNYWKSKGIFFTEVKFEFTPIFACRACDCPSGGKFKVIPSTPLMKIALISEGFVEE